ncbi:hypothetical protein HWV62_26690 [Athelia sp. TMB]|nr:hypothetical protein HWV62_27719 [Athelia sp. TMB]KAF7982776.1 hypothetical protein HWV62_26690 [Athelia sp. TMB]
MLLSHICQRWRAIALSTPSLWSHIFVGADHMFNDLYAESEIACTRTWLARAEHCPLSVYVDGYPGSTIDIHPKTAAYLESALRLLLAHSMQWSWFSMEFRQIHAFGAPSADWPLLESLELKYFDAETLPPPFEVFLTAPHLRRLTLRNSRLSFIKIPWNQLTHCEVIAPLGDEVANILRLSPNLESLEVKYAETRSMFLLAGPHHLQHLRLSILKFRGDNRGGIRQFFDQISLPSLRELSCLHLGTSLLSFLSRSACNLVSLQIYGPFKFEESFTDLLRVVPDLQSLRVAIEPSGWVELAQVLTLTPENSLIRGLQSLEVYCTSGSEPAHPAHLCASLFSTAVQSRWASVLAAEGLRYMELRSNFASEAFRKALLPGLEILVENSVYLSGSSPKRQTVLAQAARTYGRFDVFLDGRRSHSL